jgi:hypothetical protein
MNLSDATARQIREIAAQTLDQFSRIAEAARVELGAPLAGAGVLASVNTLTSDSAVRSLGRVSQANRESARILVAEPAIARVVVSSGSGGRRTYYICRAAPPAGVDGLASYRAPLGRLAALPVGETLSLPGGTYEVLERAQLHPALVQSLWDSRGTVVEGRGFGPVTVESLRVLLGDAGDEGATIDLLGQLLAAESQKANVFEGRRRGVIAAMALRDQPILDQYQDEIFRLPLDARLLILGPAGTGKTTTLIRRLGQKLDIQGLSDDERAQVLRAGRVSGETHTRSWVMFTPTELLKQYLKEAFAREGVPASELRIRTWTDYRRELGRNVFGVLKTPVGGGPFVLKETAEILAPDANDGLMAWASDFDAWQRSAFLEEIGRSARRLSEQPAPDVAAIGRRLIAFVQRASSDAIATTLSELASAAPAIQARLTDMKKVTDDVINGALNLQLNRSSTFVADLARFLDDLPGANDLDADDGDDAEPDEDEPGAPAAGLAAAVAAYVAAVRAQALAEAVRRRIGRNTRNAKVLEWLGDRGLDEAKRADVGASLVVQAAARAVANPVRRYVGGVSRRYRVFRRTRRQEGRWYLAGEGNPTDLHPLELDVVLLALLRVGQDLTGRPDVLRDIDSAVWTPIKPCLELQKNQVMVDEATDFSPVQLACMAAMAHPQIRSFVACGDFNQRLTTWGSRSIDEVKAVLPDVDVREITVSYRQTRQLNELASAIVAATGDTRPAGTMPPDVDVEGVKPVLLEGARHLAEVVGWMAPRVREIESFVRQFPSTAVFVPTEAEVQPLADALNAALADENTMVVACPKGQVMGQDNDVRVFDVQHIKGLEFEAVFFVGVDRLAVLHPQLFDRYLYVGATRAATYLGLTCDEQLPASMAPLRPMFGNDWKTP